MDSTFRFNVFFHDFLRKSIVISFLFLKNVGKEREREREKFWSGAKKNRKIFEDAKLCKCAKNQCLICRISPKISDSIFSKSCFIFFTSGVVISFFYNPTYKVWRRMNGKSNINKINLICFYFC